MTLFPTTHDRLNREAAVMTAITPESTPPEDGHNAAAVTAFSDDGILNAWLSTNPAPGTYRAYKRMYLARQNRAERMQPTQEIPFLPTQRH
jgi:hypothetical protein